MTLTMTIQLILALGLLFAGRKLYWLFVGAVGFIAASEWVLVNFSAQPEWMVILIGLAVGIVGAVLAVISRMVGVGLAGFLGGAYLLMEFSQLLEIAEPTSMLVLTIVGGIIGLVLALSLFDWALILISSLTGAILLTNFVPGPAYAAWIVLVVLAGIGIFVQSNYMEPA